MMRDSYAHRQQNPPLLESMEIVVALVLMAVCWFAWYVARERFYLTNRQVDPDVIVLVHREPAHLAYKPVVGQRLGPGCVHLVSRRLRFLS